MRMILIYAFIIACPRPIVKHHFSVGYIFSVWDMMASVMPRRGRRPRRPIGEIWPRWANFPAYRTAAFGGWDVEDAIPYNCFFYKIDFAKYDFCLSAGVRIAQTCRRYALFGDYVEILIKTAGNILDFCANSCIMDYRLKIGGIYFGRIDRRTVR